MDQKYRSSEASDAHRDNPTTAGSHRFGVFADPLVEKDYIEFCARPLLIAICGGCCILIGIPLGVLFVFQNPSPVKSVMLVGSLASLSATFASVVLLNRDSAVLRTMFPSLHASIKENFGVFCERAAFVLALGVGILFIAVPFNYAECLEGTPHEEGARYDCSYSLNFYVQIPMLLASAVLNIRAKLVVPLVVFLTIGISITFGIAPSYDGEGLRFILILSTLLVSAIMIPFVIGKDRLYRQLFLAQEEMKAKREKSIILQKRIQATLRLLFTSSEIERLVQNRPIDDFAEVASISVLQLNDYDVWRSKRLPKEALAASDVLFNDFDAILLQDFSGSPLRKAVVTGDMYVVALHLRCQKVAKVSDFDTTPILLLAEQQLERVRVRSRRTGIEVQIGVATGCAYGCLLGDETQVRYNIAGPAFEEARQISLLAQPNTVIVCRSTVKYCRSPGLELVEGAASLGARIEEQFDSISSFPEQPSSPVQLGGSLRRKKSEFSKILPKQREKSQRQSPQAAKSPIPVGTTIETASGIDLIITNEDQEKDEGPVLGTSLESVGVSTTENSMTEASGSTMNHFIDHMHASTTEEIQASQLLHSPLAAGIRDRLKAVADDLEMHTPLLCGLNRFESKTMTNAFLKGFDGVAKAKTDPMDIIAALVLAIILILAPLDVYASTLLNILASLAIVVLAIFRWVLHRFDIRFNGIVGLTFVVQGGFAIIASTQTTSRTILNGRINALSIYFGMMGYPLLPSVRSEEVTVSLLIIIMSFVMADALQFTGLSPLDIRIIFCLPFLSNYRARKIDGMRRFRLMVLDNVLTELMEAEVETHRKILNMTIPSFLVPALLAKTQQALFTCVVQQVPDSVALALHFYDASGLEVAVVAGRELQERRLSTSGDSNSSESVPQRKMSREEAHPKSNALKRMRFRYTALENALSCRALHAENSILYAIGDTVLIGGPIRRPQRKEQTLAKSAAALGGALSDVFSPDHGAESERLIQSDASAMETSAIAILCTLDSLLKAEIPSTFITAAFAFGSEDHAVVLGQLQPTFHLVGIATRTAERMLAAAPFGCLCATTSFLRAVEYTQDPGLVKMRDGVSIASSKEVEVWRLRGVGSLEVRKLIQS